jgi:hypothetical protein
VDESKSRALVPHISSWNANACPYQLPCPCSIVSGGARGSGGPARAGNRRFELLSALRAHTKVPYNPDLHRKTLRALNRP